MFSIDLLSKLCIIFMYYWCTSGRLDGRFRGGGINYKFFKLTNRKRKTFFLSLFFLPLFHFSRFSPFFAIGGGISFSISSPVNPPLCIVLFIFERGKSWAQFWNRALRVRPKKFLSIILAFWGNHIGKW